MTASALDGEGVVLLETVASGVDVRIKLLGSFDVTSDDRRIDLTTPAQRLIAYLALHPHPMRRGHVAGTLWLDSSEEHAAGCLRSALWRIRQTSQGIVAATSRDLQLMSTVVVDVHEMAAWARRIADPRYEIDAEDVRQAVAGAELLPDWYDDWVQAEREHLRQQRLHALELMCQRLISANRYAEAMEVAQAAVRVEPLRESAQRAVIQVHIAEGNASEALRQYRLYSELLRQQLGVEPSTQIQQLFVALDVRLTAR